MVVCFEWGEICIQKYIFFCGNKCFLDENKYLVCLEIYEWILKVLYAQKHKYVF